MRSQLLLASSWLLGLTLLISSPRADSAGAEPARVGGYLNRSLDWFRSEEAARIATNILSYQSTLGGWPKNLNTTAARQPGDRSDLQPTFDNGATTGELTFLARSFQATANPACRAAFERGFNYILNAQYGNGGWPQSFPPGTGYARHITFNDDAMVRLMQFLRDAYTSDLYSFLAEDQKVRARAAFQRGIQCILKCQVRVNGKLTAWCAQHDEKDFSPGKARTYELPSLSGAESVAIVRLLMSLDQPSPEATRSIRAAIDWFESAKLKGIKVVLVPDPKSPKGTDKRVIVDPAAPPMWARFYEIGTNRPIYCDRDGVPKYQLSEIGYERRNGYSWLGYWPQSLLEREFPAWSAKH